jgi:hypothetical protein
VSPKKYFFRKVTSGKVTDEKEYAINAFLWEKFSTICFDV